MEISTIRMISLNGLNFQSWKEKMKDLLYIKIISDRSSWRRNQKIRRKSNGRS